MMKILLFCGHVCLLPSNSCIFLNWYTSFAVLLYQNFCSLYFQFVDGEPIYKGCCRTNVGGFHVTDYLKQLLSLKYPYHM